jgi:hypothetical protein
MGSTVGRGGGRSGLPDFYWYNIPKEGKMYQITIKYSKGSQYIPNSRQMDKMAL